MHNVNRDSFKQHLKTFMFTLCWCMQSIRGFTTMYYIHLLFHWHQYQCTDTKPINVTKCKTCTIWWKVNAQTRRHDDDDNPSIFVFKKVLRTHPTCSIIKLIVVPCPRSCCFRHVNFVAFAISTSFIHSYSFNWKKSSEHNLTSDTEYNKKQASDRVNR